MAQCEQKPTYWQMPSILARLPHFPIVFLSPVIPVLAHFFAPSRSEIMELDTY